jgi:hypothetical protein
MSRPSITGQAERSLNEARSRYGIPEASIGEVIVAMAAEIALKAVALPSEPASQPANKPATQPDAGPVFSLPDDEDLF